MSLSHHTGDGGNKARSPRRARRKPLKPLRREGRLKPPLPVATTLVCFFSCTRGYGCGGHPVFPAPSNFEGREIHASLGRECVAGMRKYVFRYACHCNDGSCSLRIKSNDRCCREHTLLSPPLWGRAGEGVPQAPTRVAAPLPNPPPQGGRERIRPASPYTASMR
jgi:hypothetical protein